MFGEITGDNGMNITEKDWKLFRERLSKLAGKIHEKLVEEYMEILSDDRNASDKYWALEARLKER